MPIATRNLEFSLLQSRHRVPARVAGWVGLERSLLCLPLPPALPAWHGKRGKGLARPVQDLAAKLLVWREASAAPWHLAGSPAGLLRKYLVQRSSPATLAASPCPCSSTAEEPDLQARPGQARSLHGLRRHWRSLGRVPHLEHLPGCPRWASQTECHSTLVSLHIAWIPA